MFNWFKSKIELKNNNSIMSSFYNRKGLKLGNEIIVPQNFDCLIYYNSKHYITLSSGKYKVSKDLLHPLIKHQKRKSNIKYVKCVCHYINNTAQKMEISYKKQKFSVDFSIENSLNFAELMLLYTYKVDNNYVKHTLNDIFIELLIYFKGNYKQINNKSLDKYGIIINSFLPDNHKASIFDVNSKTNNTQQDNNTANKDDINPFNAIEKNDTEPTKNELEIVKINTKQSNQQNQPLKNDQNSQIKQSYTTACPKCNHISKFNTTYCLRCGYKLQ